MPKAEIKNEEGLHIIVEGSKEEVESIIAFVKNGVTKVTPTKEEVPEEKSQVSKKTLVNFILDLRSEGFFDKPQGIGEVKTALEQKAHFYSLPVVSTALIRRVQNGELGRVMEGKKWCYVKR